MSIDCAAEIGGFIKSHPAQSETGHVYYGLSLPTMQTFIEGWIERHEAVLTFDDWVATLDALYRGESVEERVMPGLLLSRFPRFRRELPLNYLDGWLGELNGWREVDGTCQSVFSTADLISNWERWQPFLEQLASDTNINKRRASLVLLTKPVRESVDDRIAALAFESMEKLVHERDKLITKAISWLLRESIKRHRARVEAFIGTHADALSNATVKEVRSKLTTGKKQ